ncbi:uncharacterized protein [Atheta coriaria]|uniref:uncharacterized protein isoform X3 n=1 Tax=Dalotia coriaria TaxID=877792 RepID=UPI0031F3DF09
MHNKMFAIGCSLLVFVIISVNGQDDYLQDAAQSCHRDRDMISCGKYNLLRFLDTAGSATVLETNTSYPVQLVKIHDPDESGSFFNEGRALANEGEFGKMLQFLQKRADRFLRTQGITVPLPDGFRVIDDDDNNVEEARGRVGPKKRGLISLLTLFGVFKVKVLLALALLGIFFIKKIFLIGALVLPSILHNLKAKCAHVLPPHHIGHSGHGEEYHDDYYGNYGHSGYNKEWERRYRVAAAAQAGAQGALKTVTM